MMLLLELTVRSSIMVLAGLAMSTLLRRRSAAVRHCILAGAVFAAAAVFPLSRVLPAWDVAPPPVSASHAAASHSVAQAPGAQPQETVASADRRLPGGVTPSALVALVWLAGVAAGAAALLAGCGRVLWTAARAERMDNGRWLRLGQEVARACGIERQIIILQTDAPGLLATWGLLRPRVLLPSHAPEWSDDRARVVLYHELAHIRRHDWLVQITAEILRTVYWFNPLLWIACTRLRRESEQACDDAVLDAGVPARDYAGHLLELARSCRPVDRTWASAVPMARPSTLEGRITAMLNPRLNRTALSRRAVIITAIVVAGLTVPTAAFRAGQKTAQPLSGSVYDSSGGVLPQVELTLEDAQHVKWNAVTDGAGRFEFPAVQPGQYVLEASLMGFRQLRHSFELRNARDWDRAITLQVGEVNEKITITAPRGAVASPSSQPQGPQPIRVGGNIRVPLKTRDVKPVYPAAMRDAGREGVVPIEAIIGRDGAVASVRVLSAQIHPDFAKAAVEAVSQWRFEPTLLNGEPVEVAMIVSVEFRLAE